MTDCFHYSRLILVAISLLVSISISSCTPQVDFNGKLAYEHIIAQVELGPRTPGSDAHKMVIEYITNELIEQDWIVEIQQGEVNGHLIQNIIAKKGMGAEWVIFGAHYDNRFIADYDTDLVLRTEPVPGANDGASGVAVLLELARVIPNTPGKQVWLVFFDAEDQGRIPGWDWILGSRYFVETLNGTPSAVVVVDMIGDADLQIYRERSSDIQISEQLWSIADNLGFDAYFINETKYNLIDDHLPFIEAGIPAALLIDFDYPHWHTSQDTSDKVSPNSLSMVGRTLLHWLIE